MRHGWSCFLLEARSGSLTGLQRCLERWRIDCRREVADRPEWPATGLHEAVLVVELDGAAAMAVQPHVEAWRAAGRSVLALCRAHDIRGLALAASLGVDEILTQPLDESELVRRLERLGDLATLERERRLRLRLFAPYQTGRYGWTCREPVPLPAVCVLGERGALPARVIDALPAVTISHVERAVKLPAVLATRMADLVLATRLDELGPVLAAIDDAETPIGAPVVLLAYRGMPKPDPLPPTVDLLPLPAPMEIVRTRLGTALRLACLRRWLRRPPQAERPNLLTDSLTGLYNTGLLLDYLSITGRPQQPALIAIDVVNLGAINARAGHAAGNLALAELGRHLSCLTRPDDLAAYLGAGRFAVAVMVRAQAQLKRLRSRLAHELGARATPGARLMVGAEAMPRHGTPTDRLEHLFRELSCPRHAA